MGIAYGAGAVRKRQAALWISGIGVFLGAMIGGGEVVKTIGSGIIPASILNVHIVVIILGSSAISLFIANIAGIPLSTSEVTVGSIVGVGVAFQAVFTDKLLVIVMYWLTIPIAAFFLAFLIGQLLKKTEAKPRWLKQQKWAHAYCAGDFNRVFRSIFGGNEQCRQFRWTSRWSRPLVSRRWNVSWRAVRGYRGHLPWKPSH